MAKQRLFIEAGSIAEKNMSGVGHTALSLVRELASNDEFIEAYTPTLIVPFNKINLINAHNLPTTVEVRKIYLPGRVMNGLVRFSKLPYMDLFFGKGIYLFPNFKNWPLLRSKNITYIHDVYFKVAPEHIESKNLDLLERHTQRFINRSNVVVTVSEHAKMEIERYFTEAKHKVKVVYNGVDHSLYYPRSQNEQDAVAKKYNLINKKYFVFFSNIEPRKNVAVLLEAYKLFIDETGENEIALILVGGMGWANEAIIERLTELQAKGYRIIKPSAYVPDTDMPALLTGSIALAHPAVYEGFGLTPLEAMACGRPVIVGDNSSLPEVMGVEYRDYTNINDPRAIKDAMVRLYNAPRRDYTYGIKRSSQFSWHTSAEQLARIIKGL